MDRVKYHFFLCMLWATEKCIAGCKWPRGSSLDTPVRNQCAACAWTVSVSVAQCAGWTVSTASTPCLKKTPKQQVTWFCCFGASLTTVTNYQHGNKQHGGLAWVWLSWAKHYASHSFLGGSVNNQRAHLNNALSLQTVEVKQYFSTHLVLRKTLSLAGRHARTC